MFTAVCMTLRTVATVVAIFILMLLIHFLLRMAIGACPARRVATRVTRRTIVVCAPVPGWKTVAERRPRKRICIVTI